MQIALSMENVSKEYPNFKLQIASLKLPSGSIMGLVGPNGAGKSTMIKAILNLVPPDTGRITVLGRDHLKQEIEVKQLVGYVPEESNLYEEATPVWLGRFVAHYYATWDDTYYRGLLEKFQIPLRKKVKQLSKGSKMKLSLALQLAHRPDLLLLDEPTAGLDPVARRDLLQELLEVIQDEKRSVLFSSHIVGDVSKVADYVAFLKEGSIVLCEDKEKLLENWRQVQFKVSHSDKRKEIANLFAYGKYCGHYFQGITDHFNEQLLVRLKELGAENIQAVPLDLEDIMVILSRGGI